MRALSLIQPWCGLVASGRKLIENRPRSMIKPADFGKPFALHASGKIDELVYDRIEEIDPDLRLLPSIITCTSLTSVAAPPWYRLSRITSAVIGVATIERAVKFDLDGVVVDLHTGERVGLGEQHRWFFGPIGYVLRDARALTTPVPCPGKQPFWHVPDNIEAQIAAQLTRAS